MYSNNRIQANIKNTITAQKFQCLTREFLWFGGSRSRAPPCASGRQELGSVEEGDAAEEQSSVTHHQQLHQRVLPQGLGPRLERRKKHKHVKGGNAAGGSARAAPYLVVNRDLGVGVALVERFDLADVLLLGELHHPEHHRNLCWKPGELQLTVRRAGEERKWGGEGGR